MTRRRHNGARLRSDFSLGGEQAEADPLLQRAFFSSDDYAALDSRLDPRCFVIGRTGGGKSAAFQRLEEVRPDQVIRITPEDLSLTYITDMQVMRYLDSLDVHLDLLFIALWKHVLLVEVIRHRYKVDSPSAKQNFLSNLRQRIQRDPAKRAALDYLDEFEGKFWCEADERVREITQRFEQRIKAEANAQLALPGVGKAGTTAGGEVLATAEARLDQAERFQRIVNETQLARLNKMMSVLDEDILDSPQHFTYVVVDDLDRDWIDKRLANDLIRCLFRTVLDLKRVRNLKVLVALRTNIFEQLNFAERASGQEEKFRSLILQLRWSRRGLTQLLDERVRAAADLWEVSGLGSVRDLLPRASKARGDPLEFILSRTLMRPRDAIAYMNETISIGSGKAQLSWADLHAAELPYSDKRLLALRDEWKLNYPDIDKVLGTFRRVTTPMSREDFTTKLDDAILLMADREFRGVLWLTALSSTLWQAGTDQRDWVELYQPLIRLLFNVGFIGCSTSKEGRVMYSQEDASWAERTSNLEATSHFHIHPAFRAALDVATGQRQGDAGADI